jgi:CRISPR system Cascade subunit CasD
MTAVVDLGADSPVTAEQIVAALDYPARPLFIGRTSCPPACRLAGQTLDASSLEAAVIAVAHDNAGDIYLPAASAAPSWGDMPVSIPGTRDWQTYRHSGSELYVMRGRG